MKLATQKRWTMVSVLGLGYWFFGNLYEAIVISPNWISNSPHQLKILNEFFVNTSPTAYFVPVTQLASVLVWVLLWQNQWATVKADLKKASIFILLATIVNIYIVKTIVLKLFSPDFQKYSEHLNELAWRWNILNLVRMVLVATTGYFLFQSYRKVDKLSAVLPE